MGCASSSHHDQSKEEDQHQYKHKTTQEAAFTDIKQQSTAASASSSSSQGDAARSSKYSTRGGHSGGNGRGGASSSPSNLLEQLHSDIVFSLTAGSAEDIGSFFSGGEDSVINQFNIHSRLRHQSKAHQRTVTDLKWHTARRELFSASRDKTIKQWKAAPEGNSLSLLQTFNGHSLPISSIDVVQQSSGDPIALVSGARDYQLRFWDIERGECLYWTEVQQNIITQVKWLQSEPLVLQASEDLSLRVWDARTREAVQTFSDGPYFALHCDVSSDNNYFLTGHNGFEGVGCELKLFDRRTGKKVVEIQAGRQAVTDACFVNGMGGLKALTASKDATFALWDLEAIMRSDLALADTLTDTGLLASHQLDQSESVQSLATRTDNGRLPVIASGHVNGRVSLWDIDLESKQFRLQMIAPGTSE